MSARDITAFGSRTGSPRPRLEAVSPRYGEKLIFVLLALCAGISVATTSAIVISLIVPTIGFFGALGAVAAIFLTEQLLSISSVLILLVMSMFLAIGLNPVVEFFMRRGIRRGLSVLVGGMGENDVSAYPDCRDNALKSLQVALSLGMDRGLTIETPLMWLDKAGIWALTEKLGGEPLRDERLGGHVGIRHRRGVGLQNVPALPAEGGAHERRRFQRRAREDGEDRGLIVWSVHSRHHHRPRRVPAHVVQLRVPPRRSGRA